MNAGKNILWAGLTLDPAGGDVPVCREAEGQRSVRPATAGTPRHGTERYREGWWAA